MVVRLPQLAIPLQSRHGSTGSVTRSVDGSGLSGPAANGTRASSGYELNCPPTFISGVLDHSGAVGGGWWRGLPATEATPTALAEVLSAATQHEADRPEPVARAG